MKRTVFIYMFLFVSSILFAQSEQIISEAVDQKRIERIDSLLDDLFLSDADVEQLIGSQGVLHYLYARSVYNTRTYFAGREIGQNQWNIGSQLFYLNSKGMFLGLSGVYYSQLDPGYRTTVFLAGYSNSISKNNFLRYRMSYEKYFFHNTDPDFVPIYKQGLNAGITAKYKVVGLRADGSLNFGDYDPGKSLSVDLFGDFVLYQKGKRNKIKFKPEISLNYGLDYAEIMLDQSLIDPETGVEYSSYYKDVFGLMNVQVQLPLSFTYKNFDMQLSYYYNMPKNFVNETVYPNSSFLQFSIGYFFLLK